MTKIKVFDLPTRLFHWCFAGLFVTIYFITNTFDDESTVFTAHMLLGLMLVFITFLRLIWGVMGSKYARFSSFVLAPRDLLAYLKAVLTGTTEAKVGRNPASSWAALTMMGLGFGLGGTGYLMATGRSTDTLEEVHELMANGFLVVALLHIGGIVLHMVRHKDKMGLSMIHGFKNATDTTTGISHSYRAVGLGFMVLIALFTGALLHGYTPANQSLHLFGQTLQLSEDAREGESGEEYEERSGSEDRDDQESEATEREEDDDD